MNEEVIKKFKKYFAELHMDDTSVLNEIYSDKVFFKDPIHEINGRENLKSYFKKLNENLIQGSFLFTDESIVDNKAYLSWEMSLKLKKPKKYVQASGISVLTFEQKITKHRDYFDAGELFYENIPILGSMIRFIKKKIATDEK
jgi:limonene-1,2-epoxide hydrolase